ncbi:MAG: DUF1972 domain-containing protein [Rhodococcus sp. (in: high G+C Gram-positive bacteria)]|uniref:glycosyltransferase n=1 Tax=Rhodococcus sp. TaxID=1831 RepID=UPI0012009667|nr:glycosyltransferase [Rhodococcus sp. (in: high G+C Gram-positive bacteria)]RZL22689.1 MAG: DUF1972 domain-containing protein [Rhodococcus sp. (in: high G+C Gram-positive bacteria)]
MKSVAIIGTRGYPSFYGGFETLVRYLAPYLVEQGWEVLVYGRGAENDDAHDDFDTDVIRINTRGLEKKSLSTLTYGATSAVDAWGRKPDVALVMNVANGFWLPILKSRGIPTVVNVDGIEWERAKWGRVAKSVFRAGARTTAMFADELIFDAEAIGDRWRSEFKRSGVFIPYGGDVPTDILEPSELRGRKYVLVVARFVPENSILEFLDAASALSEKWDIAIVGSSGYGGEIDDRVGKLASENDRVHWFGHVKDDSLLFGLWAHASAYFHGHSVGGTNPALVQAMACGAPTVARDTVYNREVLADAAIYVQPRSIDIVKSIDSLMENAELQATLSGRAKDRAADRYTWESVCAAYDKCLSEASSDS